MSKTFLYEDEDVEFEYEVDNSKLLPAVAELLFADYFLCVRGKEANIVFKGLKKMIDELDILEELADIYEESLEDAFEDEAIDWYRG